MYGFSVVNSRIFFFFFLDDSLFSNGMKFYVEFVHDLFTCMGVFVLSGLTNNLRV